MDKPLYLIQKDHPTIEEWESTFEMFERDSIHTVNITVTPEAVDVNDIHMAQDFVLVLQHYPQLIEKMLFGLHFKFEEIAGSEIYYPAEYWKSQPKYQLYFSRMLSLPMTLFFLNDEEARLHLLAGNFIANGKFEAKPGSNNMIRFSESDQQTIADRLATACFSFLLYCHGTGFNPKDTIEAILADYPIPITYEEIFRNYEEHIKKGVQVRVQKSEEK